MINSKNPRYFYYLLHTMALERHVTRTFISLVDDSLFQHVSTCLSAFLPGLTPAPRIWMLSGKVRARLSYGQVTKTSETSCRL